ncbi:hypothetical protein WMY93_025626 [Mugilogobius chulae]|uniref:SCP domain-containing protein n=1 Tax=Mugilogobius chulae TaxID=88201 RepID=A0AAW0MZF8_9GOBI
MEPILDPAKSPGSAPIFDPSIGSRSSSPPPVFFFSSSSVLQQFFTMFMSIVLLLTVQQALSACVPSSPPPPPSGLCTNSSTVQSEIVDVHNEFRRNVQPPAQDMLQMDWDDKLVPSIQAWVDGCVFTHGKPSTRMLDGYELGENLFKSSSPVSWTSVVTAWHNEVNNFEYPTSSTNGKPIGHYTQVIWNSSYKIGCAMAKCPNDIYFFGCRYYRAGNFRGWKPYTKGESCGMCPNNCVNKLCTNPCPYKNDYLNCLQVSPNDATSQQWLNTARLCASVPTKSSQ